MDIKEYRLKQFFNCSIREGLEQYDFSQTNKDLMSFYDDMQFADAYPDLYLKLYNQKHCRDSRTPLMFAQDMIRSWLFEDIVQALLSSNEVLLEHNGSDSDRNFSGRPTNQADFSINYYGTKYNVELQIGFCKTNFENGFIPVRDYKIQNMVKDKDFFLIVDLHLDQIYFTLIDMTKPFHAEAVDDLATYNKRGCYLDIRNQDFYLATPENFAAVFNQAVYDRYNN